MLYEYQCVTCNQKYEYVTHPEDRSNQKCPVCGNKLELMVPSSLFKTPIVCPIHTGIKEP